MGRIINFEGDTTLEQKPDDILENNKGEFSHCGTYSDIKDIVFLLERFKLFLLRQVEAD